MNPSKRRTRKAPAKRYNVSIIFPTSAISQISKMSGIFRYLSSEHHWNLTIISPDAQPPDFTNTDGIIVTGSPSSKMRRAIEQTDKPTVAIALDFARSHLLTSVSTDGDAIGRDVANEFLRQGVFRSAVFVRARKPSLFQLCYEQSLRNSIHNANLQYLATTEENLDEILCLPRPVLAIAPNDYIAAHAVSFGLSKGLVIPGDLSVLGMLNDVVFCENHNPPLSSVELDFEKQGYLAAKALQNLMSNGKSADILSVGLKSIVRRATTPALSAGDSLVKRGISYIRRNSSEPITVKDVVSHLKVSRRLAEMRFREIVNRTILSVIVDERLEATQHALLSSDEPIGDICRKCGWKSENYPKLLFHRKFGQSMSAWRSAHLRQCKSKS